MSKSPFPFRQRVDEGDIYVSIHDVVKVTVEGPNKIVCDPTEVAREVGAIGPDQKMLLDPWVSLGVLITIETAHGERYRVSTITDPRNTSLAVEVVEGDAE